MSSQKTIMYDTMEGDKIELRLQVLNHTYNERYKLPFVQQNFDSIKASFKRVIQPQMKFYRVGDGFGSIEKPNFTDPNQWYSRLFADIVTFKDMSDGMKAKTWLTYKSKIKELFSMHRSRMTNAIRSRFIEGLSIGYMCMCVIFSVNFLIFNSHIIYPF